MGESVNGRLKHRHMPAARIPGRIAEAVFLVAAVDIFPEQVRLTRRLNLLLCYAGHDAGTGILFIVPRLLLIYKCRVSVPNNQLGLNPLIV